VVFRFVDLETRGDPVELIAFFMVFAMLVYLPIVVVMVIFRWLGRLLDKLRGG